MAGLTAAEGAGSNHPRISDPYRSFQRLSIPISINDKHCDTIFVFLTF